MINHVKSNPKIYVNCIKLFLAGAASRKGLKSALNNIGY